jgi:hypothetical protein
MSGYRKSKRRSKKQPPLEAAQKRSEKATPRRARWGADFRDKIAILVAVALLISIVVFSFLSLFRSDQPDEESVAPMVAEPATGPRAAIVDQLSLTYPNPAFTETATELLKQAGYAVDYYPGEQVTVDFYRDLPTGGHRFLILRNHSSVVGTGTEVTEEAGLYTSEPYSERKYLDEQLAWRLMVAKYHEGGPEYFGITPEFVKSSMRGKFDDATIIMMGCDGLRSDMLAEAFVLRGAQAVVSWSGPVGAAHTDAATEHLLRHLLLDGLTIQEAVTQTMAEVGPDPAYDSVLRLYPSEEPVSAAP